MTKKKQTNAEINAIFSMENKAQQYAAVHAPQLLNDRLWITIRASMADFAIKQIADSAETTETK